MKTPPGVIRVWEPLVFWTNFTWTFKYIGPIPKIHVLNSPEIEIIFHKQIDKNAGKVTLEVRINKTGYVGKLYLQVVLLQTRGGRRVARISTVFLQIVSGNKHMTTEIRYTQPI